MGYSNNKWRKILIILSIINLCLVLFGRFSNVLATSESSINDYPAIPNLYTNQGFIIATNGNYNLLFVFDKDIIDGSTIPKSVWYNLSGNNKLLTFPSDSGKIYRCLKSNPTSWSFYSDISSSNHIDRFGNKFDTIILSSVNIYYANTSNIYFEVNYNPFIAPNFDNITEIENGYPDGVFVSRGSYSENDYLYFHLLKITNTVPDGNQSTYYYESKIYKLKIGTKYYRTYPADTEHKHSYYYITRSQLTLDTNSSYLYVLSNSSEKIDSSYGILQPDIPGGIYDVIASDTAGVITEQDAINDKMSNINETQQEIANSQQEVANNSNNINNFLNENTVSNESNNNINTSLNFDNSAPQFSSLFNGYFSRLTSIVSDLGNYQDTDVITISIPIPFTNNTIPISSNFIFANQNNNFLKNLSTTLWYFIFGRYFLYFLINIYWLIANGQFFDYYLTQKEVITGDML